MSECNGVDANRPVRHLDLFSGIGGFALAAEWAGWQTVGFSEIDEYASKVLSKHWPNVKNHGDIKNIGKVECDIITGGFPCQPFLVAGSQKAQEDDRHLWPQMLRVIKQCRPTWVLGENVARLTSDGIVTVLQDLYQIGYDAEWHCVPAYAVGAPHERDRIWVVAYPMQQGEARRRTCRIGGWGGCKGEARQDGWDGAKKGNVQLWTEPSVDRVAYGIPNGVDRINALGNAIVPQVAAEILRRMMRFDSLPNK
jgi:DNA (cytosine-5)-methyltransferase 1